MVLNSVLLPALGIADQRGDGQPLLLPVLPVQGAAGAHVVELCLEALDAVAHQAPVGLDLRLAGPPGADTAAETLQVRPLACQPRQQVLVLR